MPPKKPYTYPAFETLLDRARSQGVTLWATIECDFLAIVSDFDADFIAGKMTIGDYKAKARYLNDLLAILITNRTGCAIATRGKRRGKSFPKHDIDLAYPASPLPKPQALGEVKAAGMPPHPGNISTSGPNGRPVYQDLDKRIREIGFTATDIKWEWAEGGVLTLGDKNAAPSLPLYGCFYAARVADKNDLRHTRSKLAALADHYADAVGAFIYEAQDPTRPTDYSIVKPDPGRSMDEALDAFVAAMVVLP